MSGRLLRIKNWEELAKEAGFQPSKMAVLCGVSLHVLEDNFKAEIGRPPGRWLCEMRCLMAMRLLLKGWKGQAVASELGYTDESHFYHEFKRIVGLSPREFIRSSVAGSTGRRQSCPQQIPYVSP